VFPETPIAAQLLSQASSPEDLLQVALQMRDEYSSLRRSMCDLESQLCGDDITLEKKTKICRQLHAMAQELRKDPEGALRRETVDLTGLVAAIPAAGEPLSLATTSNAVGKLMSLPVDVLLRAIRRRRIRIMFKTKKSFLRLRSSCSMLASLFGFSASEVRKSMAKYQGRR